MTLAQGTGDTLILKAEQGYGESRGFNTRIFRAQDGTESRVSEHPSEAPLRAVGFRFSTGNRESLTTIEGFVTYALINSGKIPLWFSLSLLTQATSGIATIACVTANREFESVDQLVIIKADLSDYVVRTINTVNATNIVLSSSVAAGFAIGSFVLPVINANPDQSNVFAWQDHRSGDGAFGFEENNIPKDHTPDSLGLDTYESLDIWPIEPRQSVTNAIGTPFRMIGDFAGNREKYTTELPEKQLTFVLFQDTISERSDLRDFFDLKRGQLTAFWIRSYKHDRQLSRAASSGASTIWLNNSMEEPELSTVTRHVYDFTNESYHKITNPSVSGDETSVSIDPVLTGDLPINSFLQNAYVVRFFDRELSVQSLPRIPDVTRSVIRLQELQRETP